MNVYQLSDAFSPVTSHTSGILPNKCLLPGPHPLISLSLSVNCEIVNTDYKSISRVLQTNGCSFTFQKQVMYTILQTKLDIFTHFCAYSQRWEHFEFISDMIINVTFSLPYTTYILSVFFPLHIHPVLPKLWLLQLGSNTSIRHILQMVSVCLCVFHLCVPEGHNGSPCLCLCVCVCRPLIPSMESEPRVAVCG